MGPHNFASGFVSQFLNRHLIEILQRFIVAISRDKQTTIKTDNLKLEIQKEVGIFLLFRRCRCAFWAIRRNVDVQVASIRRKYAVVK